MAVFVEQMKCLTRGFDSCVSHNCFISCIILYVLGKGHELIIFISSSLHSDANSLYDKLDRILVSKSGLRPLHFIVGSR